LVHPKHPEKTNWLKQVNKSNNLGLFGFQENWLRKNLTFPHFQESEKNPEHIKSKEWQGNTEHCCGSIRKWLQIKYDNCILDNLNKSTKKKKNQKTIWNNSFKINERKWFLKRAQMRQGNWRMGDEFDGVEIMGYP
jgi:hypothetical protein